MKKGFTIVELLAVIVILAIVVLIGGNSVINVLNRTRAETTKEMQENVKEAALTYAYENVHIKTCSKEFSKEMYVDNNIANLNQPENASCIAKIKVETLKKEGLFEDKQNHCLEEDTVVIYRYVDEFGNSEYKAYTSDTTCSK